MQFLTDSKKAKRRQISGSSALLAEVTFFKDTLGMEMYFRLQIQEQDGKRKFCGVLDRSRFTV